MKKANLIFSHFSLMAMTRMGCLMRAVILSRLLPCSVRFLTPSNSESILAWLQGFSRSNNLPDPSLTSMLVFFKFVDSFRLSRPPLVNGEEGLQYTLVFVPMTKVIHQGDVALSEKLAKLVGDVLVLPLCMFPSSRGLPLIQAAHNAARFIFSFTGIPAAILIRCMPD